MKCKSQQSRKPTRQALTREILAAPYRIDQKVFLKQFVKLSRQHLKMNGISTKGLSGEACIALANQHTRAFLGMDRPNVFTGVK